jgi:hypothetical protein
MTLIRLGGVFDTVPILRYSTGVMDTIYDELTVSIANIVAWL